MASAVAAVRLTADTLAEHAAISHLRGMLHHGPSCPICMAELSGRQSGRADAIRKIAEG